MSNKKPESYSSLLSLDNEIKKKSKPITKNENSTKRTEANKSTNRRSRSRSPKYKKMKTPAIKELEQEEDWDVPDRQFGDLYCKPCDSHMNSEQMWEAHIQGKRHLKNVKKGETVGEPKYEYIDEDPIMLKELNEETRPIVGLQHLVEIQRLEQRPIYQCFLCSANVPSADQLLDHIAGVKHRLAYLKEHEPARYDLIQKSNLKKGHVEPVVEECIASFESQFGRGKMVVKREKKDYKSPPRRYKADYVNSRPSRPSDRDRDRGKVERDRPFDSFDDPARHKRHFERDSSHSRSNDYDRYGYSNRVPDSPPRNNISNRRHFDEDKYSNPRYPSYEDKYGVPPDMDARPGSSRPPFYDTYDGPRPSDVDKYGRLPAPDKYESSRVPVADDVYGRPVRFSEEQMRYMRSLNEDHYGDLREVLQKKKTSADPAPVSAGNNVLDTLIGNIPEATLQMIEAMSTTVFLQVSYFKLNRIKVETDLEIKLLDQVSNKCNSLSLEVKTKQLPSNLQEQFKETIAQSLGISPQFAKDYQQMMDMVGQVKTECKTVSSDNKSSNQLNHNTKYSDPSYTVSSYAAADNTSVSAPVTNRNPHSWQQANSAQPPAAPIYYSSTQIPGLTLTADNPPTTQSSPFDPFAVLSRHTKDLFGSAQTKTDSYRY